jgi:ribulose-phosphate 3-epimerase
MFKLAPSILSADFSKLGEDATALETAGAHLIHVDVMDGHFVPNISFGAAVMKSLYGKIKLPFDVHLMIEYPDRYINEFVTDNTKYITVHQEACTHLHRTIQLIKSCGVKAGVAINPGTSINTLDSIFADIDLVLIMSVNPGFGGQTFIESGLDKIRQVSEIKKIGGFNFEIEVDGGVTSKNVDSVVKAGAEIIVAGSAVFANGNIDENVKKFLQISENLEV